MKKWIVTILLLVVAAAAGAFYVLQVLPGAKRVSSLESLVSEDTLFYAYSYNLDKKIKEFQASDFFGKLSKTSIYKAWVEPQLNHIYQNAPFLSGFLQEDVAVALLSLGNLQSPQGSIQDLGDFLILVRLNPKKRAQIKRQVFDTYLSVTGKGKMTSKTHKGIKISKYTSLNPAFTINYAFIADVLALSNNANVIQKSIDLYQKTSKKSLSENSNFQSIRTKIKNDAWAWGYQNNEKYNQQLIAYYASGALRSKNARWAAYAVDPAQLAPMMELMNIIKASGFCLERDILKEGFLWKGYYLIGEPKSKAISEITKFITDKRILDEEVLRLIPQDILVYLGGCKDISALWKFIKFSFAQMPGAALAPSSGDRSAATAGETSKDIKDNLAKLDSFLGVSIERDILPALGDDFGFIVVNLENTEITMFGPQTEPRSPSPGSFSIALPQAYTYLELKDVPRIRAILEGAVRKLVEEANQKIKEREHRWQETIGQKAPASAEKQEDLIPQEESQPLTFLKDTYQEAEIFYIDLLNFPLAFFKPNYCFLDKYVIFSYSLPLTKKVIDVYKNKGNSFAKNLNFLSMKDKIPTGYSYIAFFDIKHTIDELKRTKFFDSMLYQMLSSAGHTGLTKEELDQLLDVLSDLVSITSANMASEQDILETNHYIKIKGL
jgi:tRNA pseudouridine-54 N-methylase